MRTALLCTVSLAAALSAQSGIRLEPCGGGVGRLLSYEIAGKTNQNFLFLTSARRATIPLNWIDPKETRTLGVGLEFPGLIRYWNFGSTGKVSFSWTVPALPALVGLALLHQAVSYPGTGTALDAFSDVVVVPFDVGGVFRQQAMSMSVARLAASGVDLGDGRLLIAGGASGTLLSLAAHKTTEVYDVATRRFTAGPSMVSARASHTQTRLKDGRYLLVGGVDASNLPQASCEIFDPKTGKFTAAASMNTARSLHAATLLSDGRVLVTGGLTSMTDLTSVQRTSEFYDPATNKWSAGPTMTAYRAAHAAVDIGNGRVLVTGGLSYTYIIIYKVPAILSTAEVFTLSSNRFARTASMSITRAMMCALPLADGRILVAGGLSGDIAAGGAATDQCQFFDPKTNGWSTAPTLPKKAAGGTPVIRRDGQRLLIGGGSNSIYWPYANSESWAFDPAANKWLALPKMQNGRFAPVSFELQSCGLILFGGGTINSGTAVATHELLVK